MDKTINDHIHKTDRMEALEYFLNDDEEDNFFNLNNLNYCQSCGNILKKKEYGMYKYCMKCNTISDKEYMDDDIKNIEINPINLLAPNYRNIVVVTGNKNSKIKKQYKYNSIPSDEYAIIDLLKKIKKILNKNLCKIYPNIEQINNIIEDDIASSLLLYKKIKSHTNKRDKTRMGIIACCYYYIKKNQYYYMSIKELNILFGLSSVNKSLTNGFKEFHKICLQDKDIRTFVDLSPLTLDNIFEIIKRKFTLSNENIDDLSNSIIMIKNNYISIINTPFSVIAGLFYNYIKYKGLSIKKKDIVDKLYVSESSIEKYSKYFNYIFY